MPTLLIVDDEPAILHAFRRAFRGDALEVLTAETAADGLELARERRPDVVVLDVHLPDRNGLEMLRQLRAIDARCPVVFISGRGDADDAIEAMKLGAYDYLLKPLELKTGAPESSTGRWPSAGSCTSPPWSPAMKPWTNAPTLSSPAARPCRRWSRPSAAWPTRT